MITASRKKHEINIDSIAVGNDNNGLHDIIVTISHNLESGQVLKWNIDGGNDMQVVASTNPTVITISNLVSDGGLHTVTVCEAAVPTNIDSDTYTAPATVTPVIQIDEMNSSPGECSSGTHTLNVQISYENLGAGGFEWQIDGGAFTVVASPGATPYALSIPNRTCDGLMHTLLVRSVADNAVTDSYAYTAPAGDCLVELLSVSPGPESNGNYDLNLQINTENVPNGELEYSLDGGTWIHFDVTGDGIRNVTFFNLVADGLSHNLDVRARQDTACSFTSIFTAPDGCSITLTNLVVNAVVGNVYSVSLDIAWTGINGDLQYTIDSGNYTDITTLSGSAGNGSITIPDLTPDGIIHVVTVRSKTNPSCSNTISYQAPAGCSASPKRPNDEQVYFDNLPSYSLFGSVGDYSYDEPDHMTTPYDPLTFINLNTVIRNYTMFPLCPNFSENGLSSVAIPAELSANVYGSDAWFRFTFSGTSSNDPTCVFASGLNAVFGVLQHTGLTGLSADNADIVVYFSENTIGNHGGLIYRGSTSNQNSLQNYAVNSGGSLLNQIQFSLEDFKCGERKQVFLRVLMQNPIAGDFTVNLDFTAG